MALHGYRALSSTIVAVALLLLVTQPVAAGHGAGRRSDATGTPVVQTKYGPVSGTREGTSDGIAAFHAIPFAAPPVGALRFRPPVPPQPWSAVVNATVMPPPECMQLSGAGSGSIVGQEDCLTLEVYTPQLPTGDRSTEAGGLPVMVWIYGGGFVQGDSYEGGQVRRLAYRTRRPSPRVCGSHAALARATAVNPCVTSSLSTCVPALVAWLCSTLVCTWPRPTTWLWWRSTTV